MTNLSNEKCVPCEGGVEPIHDPELSKYITGVRKWSLVEGNKIEREFECLNFMEALHFVNEVGKLAEGQGHHPNIYLHSWNKVKLTLFTHAIGGLSRNDFIMAAKIDGIVENEL
jgi:4a-hydroxytetrahydrobiopterin dehydratase